ncbi:hypothetical protein N658DRAFT_501748 [Parathielavia hyrcaniae]|uniref:Uncharacterized protein n=1 Tax=Parathielavia hyrcaniae TaxID=113614 RepID=A0AAN6SWE0_9PEZI|nr:hypothetical protein N658DRAFT_501748 [Parathielavia hyrcaniae]
MRQSSIVRYDVPQANLKFVGMEQAKTYSERLPVLVLMFRGCEGQDLQHLSGLSVLADTDMNMTLGVELRTRIGALQPASAFLTQTSRPRR